MPANKVSLPDGIHSKIGPSSSERWMHCPASVALSEKLRKLGKSKEAGSAAREGTAAHSVLATCLMAGKDAWEYAGQAITVEGETFIVDGEMTDGIQNAIDFVRSVMEEFENHEWTDSKGRKQKGAVLLVENMLSSVLDEEAFGTGDVLIIVPGLFLIVLDFKYGRGVSVEPHDSQLKMYSYMAWEMLATQYFSGVDKVPVKQWIMQPRIPHPRGLNRDWETDTAALTDWFVGEVVPAMIETRNPDAAFETGSHCHFCPAREHCPALQADAMNLQVNRDPVSMTFEELCEVLTKLEALGKYKSKLEEQLLARARQGERDPKGRYKLVRMQANRVWREKITIAEPDPCDPDAEPIEVEYTIEQILKREFGDKAYTAPELLGPATIEDLPGGQAWVSRCAYTPDKGLTMAKGSDKRMEQRPLITFLDSEV